MRKSGLQFSGMGQRKGQDIGRLIHVPIGSVQGTDPGVTDKRQTELGFGLIQLEQKSLGQGPVGLDPQGNASLTVRDPDNHPPLPSEFG